MAFAITTVLAMPSLYAQTVTTGADSGPGSLRQEVMDASPGDVINFGILVTSVVLNSEITIDKSITISNTNLIDVTINGDGNGRVFNITAGPVTLNNLIITNGVAADGGGIYVTNATVTIRDCDINNCVANGASGSGGGIFNAAGGVLLISNSVISNNQANRAGGGIEDNSGAGLGITLTNVTMSGNNAGVAPATAAPGNGGAVHITGPGSIDITGGSILNNDAALEGGGLWNGTGTMNVMGTTINGNTALGAASDDGGGGIFNNGGTLNVGSNTSIINNVASGTSGSGGGLFSTAGAVTIDSTMFDGNTANRAGGAIEIVLGTVVVSNSTMQNNDVNGSAGTANPGNGGAFHITGNTGSVSFSNCDVMGNDAASEGGGLWNQSGIIMTVINSTIDDNEAFGAAADNGGGGIFNNGGTLVVTGSSLNDNIASGTSGSGGGLFSTVGDVTITNTSFEGNSANRAGGAIEIVEGTLMVEGSSLFDNDVNGTAGTANPGNGGALHVSGNTAMVTFRDCDVSGNDAAREGGGLWNQTGSTLNVVASMVDDNQAFGAASDDGGGGIFNSGGTLNIDSSSISGNLASGAAGSGGGIFSLAGDVTITASSLSDNSANRAGGAIELVDGNLYFTNSEMVDNDVNGGAGTPAPGNGGGFHVTGMSGLISISGSTITGNEAAREGGGLWNQSGTTMNVSLTTVDYNIAGGPATDDGGGGIFNNGGIINITTSTISNNGATGTAGTGGGIHNAPMGIIDVMRSTISTNTSAGAGGGVYSNGDSLKLNAVTIGNNNSQSTGGGIEAASGVWLANTLVAINSGSSGNNVSGMVYSNGYNLVDSDDLNVFDAMATDIEGTAPMLGPLQDNGGETFTHELMLNSAGANAGNPTVTFNDQRDVAIIGTRDIGAFESSTPVGIFEVNNVINSSVYPNPNAGSFTIEIAKTQGETATVKVMSVAGSLIKEVNMDDSTMNIDMSYLPAGVYYVNVLTNTSVTTHSVLISK